MRSHFPHEHRVRGPEEGSGKKNGVSVGTSSNDSAQRVVMKPGKVSIVTGWPAFAGGLAENAAEAQGRRNRTIFAHITQ